MKSIAIASFAMLGFCASAQPVVQPSHVAPNFEAELYYTEVPSNFSPGPAGANQTWDFSNIGDGMLLGAQQAINASTSPFAAEFPQANYCYTMVSAFADATMYFYHSLTPSIFEIYSLGYEGEVGEDYRPNPRTYVTFPYTYGTVFNDTFQRTTDAAPVSQTVTYDAYGTLIMPFGTFNNVVRQKVVIEGNTNYAWFNVNPFYPILQTSLEDASLGYIIDNTVLDTPSAQGGVFAAYPNPVFDRLSIRFPDSIQGAVTLELSDIAGKTVRTAQIASQSDSVDLSGLQAGVYLLRVHSAQATEVLRIVKS